MLNVNSRVRAAHLCAALPSEPCMRLSPHTAQANCPEDSASLIAHGPIGPPLGSVC
jgi:hypothetical protein